MHMDKDLANKFIDEYVALCLKYKMELVTFDFRDEIMLYNNDRMTEESIRQKIVIHK